MLPLVAAVLCGGDDHPFPADRPLSAGKAAGSLTFNKEAAAALHRRWFIFHILSCLGTASI